MPISQETTNEIRRLKGLLVSRQRYGLKDSDAAIYQLSGENLYRRILKEDFHATSARNLEEKDAKRLVILLQILLSDSIFNEHELQNWTLKRWQCWQCGDISREIILHSKFPNRYGWNPSCHCSSCDKPCLPHFLDPSEWQRDANVDAINGSKQEMERDLEKSEN